jgi:hypothetical protein
MGRPRPYPAVPAQRAATVAGDVALVLLLCLFAGVAVKVHDEIDRLASIGRSIEDSGRGISATARDATGAVRGGFDGAAGAVQAAHRHAALLAALADDAGVPTRRSPRPTSTSR